MEIKINNMLEVVELIQALEERIEYVEQIYSKESINYENIKELGIYPIYEQLKKQYSKKINFRY